MLNCRRMAGLPLTLIHQPCSTALEWQAYLLHWFIQLLDSLTVAGLPLTLIHPSCSTALEWQAYLLHWFIQPAQLPQNGRPNSYTDFFIHQLKSLTVTGRPLTLIHLSCSTALEWQAYLLHWFIQPLDSLTMAGLPLTLIHPPCSTALEWQAYLLHWFIHPAQLPWNGRPTSYTDSSIMLSCLRITDLPLTVIHPSWSAALEWHAYLQQWLILQCLSSLHNHAVCLHFTVPLGPREGHGRCHQPHLVIQPVFGDRVLGKKTPGHQMSERSLSTVTWLTTPVCQDSPYTHLTDQTVHTPPWQIRQSIHPPDIRQPTRLTTVYTHPWLIRQSIHPPDIRQSTDWPQFTHNPDLTDQTVHTPTLLISSHTHLTDQTVHTPPDIRLCINPPDWSDTPYTHQTSDSPATYLTDQTVHTPTRHQTVHTPTWLIRVHIPSSLIRQSTNTHLTDQSTHPSGIRRSIHPLDWSVHTPTWLIRQSTHPPDIRQFTHIWLITTKCYALLLQ